MKKRAAAALRVKEEEKKPKKVVKREAFEEESEGEEETQDVEEPLPEEKIIEHLKEAALNDHSIVATLTETAEVDPAHCKIFVFGLRWDATTDQVLYVYKQYGDIEECKVVTD
ncbi:UBP1-associated protein 2A-like protein [Tanacetum coccineum]